ncbi:hypothetical protein BJ878DRAFT_534426 [Calycina marina]|uniref:Yeast cell wall synthesis Kre9/Knh1 C-terminal domain-containing protein n=1 Tax=Calycina marina TaxID=1763456 RepID=A0A9P8CFA8_9HELO|nr:hypothetical protein BJ878DRAFT_534426 [Calycina marina]
MRLLAFWTIHLALTFQVTWKDDGTAPAFASLASFNIHLYAGPDLLDLGSVASGTFATDPTDISVTIVPGLEDNVQNVYSLSIVSTATIGGTITNHPRFSLTGMTGTFSPALAPITVTAAPAAENNVVAAAAASVPAAAPADSVFTVPFNLQTDTIRYAPMQPIPPTSITTTNTTPFYPTSSFVIATADLPIPTIQTTITQAQTAVFTNHANTAAAASQPADAMQKYLNRWKD